MNDEVRQDRYHSFTYISIYRCITSSKLYMYITIQVSDWQSDEVATAKSLTCMFIYILLH